MQQYWAGVMRSQARVVRSGNGKDFDLRHFVCFEDYMWNWDKWIFLGWQSVYIFFYHPSPSTNNHILPNPYCKLHKKSFKEILVLQKHISLLSTLPRAYSTVFQYLTGWICSVIAVIVYIIFIPKYIIDVLDTSSFSGKTMAH